MADKQNKQTNFEALKSQFPIFKVKNRTSIPQQIMLAEGGSVQIPGSSFGSIESKNLIQAPDFRIFKPVTPSMEDYTIAGIVASGNRKAATPAAAPSTGSSSSGSPGSSIKESSSATFSGSKKSS